ncbi:MAG: SMC-Scp complex subunit ScpB [Alphaproteobacteria bacterium PRO2]|nr:SMC-Scp complex subunit ScpB [Alphaproteobacteria bacterium PRO2]
MSNEQNIRILEALLFASAAPVSTKELHDRMPEGADVGGALMELKAQYESRGVNLIETDGHWAFRTAADLANVLEIQREAQRKLSRAAMETLAIIAYHQPVTRPEIENIRGVATHRGTVDALMEMGWIKPGRRREAPGRPMTWVTTPEFLDQFSLESLADLPGLEDLKASGLLDRRPAIEAIPTGNLFADDEELESLGGSDDDDSEFESEAPSELEEEAA